jgi:hypothetical protein
MGEQTVCGGDELELIIGEQDTPGEVEAAISSHPVLKTLVSLPPLVDSAPISTPVTLPQFKLEKFKKYLCEKELVVKYAKDHLGMDESN